MKTIKQITLAMLFIIGAATVKAQVSGPQMTNDSVFTEYTTTDAVQKNNPKLNEYLRAHRSKVLMGAFKKLSKDEVGALMTFIDEARLMSSKDHKSQGVSASKLAKLHESIKELERKMAERMKVRWMAADGSEYDNYEDYYNHQWGSNPGDRWNPENWD